ncbi:hypothetical protein [Leeuwenhoekiella aequorea]|uniref:Uncharacterized protein n=1 Tax=Leeuwenhoekiella aequorea TaxID=283736 RepID=A0A4Q0PD07_9FLAO|nr:hypothetical protein [Leeuwenhoekiella aequorea]RXG24256.1 hypothetical protein DSM00_40 [Leeuwenhoekiella aequorea]
MQERLSRKEFYDLVWSKSLSKITDEYGIDYHSIILICNKNNIPRPKSSYWAKLKFGKQGVKPELSSEDQDKIIWRRVKQKADLISQAYLQGKELELSIQFEIESDSKLNLTVSNRLSKPDELIQDYLRIEAEIEKISKRRGVYFNYRDNPRVSISTTKQVQSRALRFMDCLIKNLRLRGHSFKLQNKSYKINIHGELFPFSLREVNKRVKRENDRWGSDLLGTGKLAFKIDEWWGKEWQDQKTVFVEDKISEIIAKLEYLGRTNRAKGIYQEIKYRQNEIEIQKAKAIEKQMVEEEKRFEELLNIADQWKRVENLKEFISMLEKNKDLDYDKLELLKWAKNRIEKLDYIGSLE